MANNQTDHESRNSGGSGAPQRRPVPSLRDQYWQTASLAIRPIVMAERMWRMILSEADRRQLGDDFVKAYERRHGTAGMWMFVRGVTYVRAVITIAVALHVLEKNAGDWLLRECGEVTGDAVTDMETAIAAGQLVLAECPRRIYWNKVPIPLDWNRHSSKWSFMLDLSRAAKSGDTVSREAFGEDVDMRYVARLKHSVVNLPGFPLDLADRMVAAGRGELRLDLPPARVRIFETVRGEPREWLP